LAQTVTSGGDTVSEPTETQPSVLILTPVKDAAESLAGYVAALERLSYPRKRISLGILESDSADDTYARLKDLELQLERRFRRFSLFKRDYGFHMPTGVPRWTAAFQKVRRSILARSRNQLLMRALDDEDWVLWLDVDVVDYPADLIESLLSAQRDIVHPHCVLEPGGPTFDLNAWRDKGRLLMSDLRGTNGPVRLDAVGGTVLLVRADCHRDGLIFPPFPYGQPNPRIRDQHPVWGKGELETEGLGVMAYDMGLQCWGLPDYEVFHEKK
jgi:peptide chain release factor subunit 1